jgi:hypothetical protein
MTDLNPVDAMTNPYRAMCAELVAAWDALPWEYDWLGNAIGAHGKLCDDSAVDRARALLAQPVAEGPSDEEIMELMPQQMRDDLAAAARALAEQAGTDSRRAMGIMRIILNRHAVDHARAVLAKWGRPTPQPVWADIHYAWELEDAEGEWQAGGSANSLEDVQREGNRYLQTYEQDGPHKLIIQRHCVNTIEEVTNG